MHRFELFGKMHQVHYELISVIPSLENWNLVSAFTETLKDTFLVLDIIDTHGQEGKLILMSNILDGDKGEIRIAVTKDHLDNTKIHLRHEFQLTHLGTKLPKVAPPSS